MKFELKDMYGYLLSHTFPGLLFLIEILLVLQWWAKLHVLEFAQKIWSTAAGNIVIVLILAYAFSTLLGVVIDGIHHFLFEDIWDIRQREEEEKFPAISDSLKLDIYKHFLEDDLWYPYECYANIMIVMIPGFFLLKHWLSWILHVENLWPLIIYAVIWGIMLGEAICTYRRFLKDEEQFVNSYSNLRYEGL
jgi:hypothetical protein